MNFKSLIYVSLSLATVCACTDKNEDLESGRQPEAGKYCLSGNVEKGPFVRGSSINVQPLDASLNAVGTVYSGEIADDAGAFNLGEIDLASQFVRIAGDGYYFNELTGCLSSGTLHLTAYADLSDRSSVNVNILTHLKAARVQKLMSTGSPFSKADSQAQKELLSQFGLQAYADTPAESMSISSGTDASGVLIAISSIALSNRSDAEITSFLSVLSRDLADDGEFTEDNRRTLMKDRDRVAPELEKVSRNIIDRYEELGMSVSVPDLRYFFDWNNDGIAGNEINDNADVSLSQSEVAFDKDGGVATVTVTTNIPLTLEKNGYGDTMPDGPIFSENTYLNDFFTDEGRTMECERTYEDNILTIKVAKTEKRNVQTATIPLYDYMGVCQATVNVTLAGDPSIELKLGENGKQIVAATFAQFAKAISWMCYVEQGYTGMSQYFDVKCPMTPADTYNRNAFNAAYAAVARNANFAKTLESYGYYPAVPFFQLLNAILYTEMVDKWRRVGISEIWAGKRSEQRVRGEVRGVRRLFTGS